MSTGRDVRFEFDRRGTFADDAAQRPAGPATDEKDTGQDGTQARARAAGSSRRRRRSRSLHRRAAMRLVRPRAVGRVHQSRKVGRNLLDDRDARHAGGRPQPRHDVRSAVCPARAVEDVRHRPRDGCASRRQAPRLYRGHRRLFRGRPALEDHRSRRGEDLSRLQLDSGRPARRHRIAARQVQGLARLARAAGGGRRRPDGGRADRTRQEGKGIRARRQAAHAGDRRRPLDAVVDQAQSGHAPRGRRKIRTSFSIRRSTRRGRGKKPPSRPNGSTSAIRTPGWSGRATI